MKKAVITFGRFNPMTIGHEKLVNKVKDVSKKTSGDPHIYLSHTQDNKRNPLDYKTKVKLAQRAFGSVVKKSRARTIIEIMKELEKKKYTDVHLVVGSDRVKEFDTLLQKYNGKDYTFDSIKVESAGDRDPDAEGVSGMSATKMRVAAKTGDLKLFKKGAPSKLTDKEKEIMYNKLQAILEEKDLEKIKDVEDELDDDDFEVSDKEASAAADAMNTDKLDDEDMSDVDPELDDEDDEDEEEVKEVRKPLTVAQRAKIARRMKKMAPKLKLKKAMAAKRMASPAKLKKRARKAAIQLLRKRFAGKAGANYASLAPSAKIGVDKILAKKMGAVNVIAKKMLKVVRKKEQERIKSLRSKKEEVQIDVNEMFNEMMTTRYKGKIVANQIFKTQLKAFAFASKHGGKVIRTGKEFRVTVPRQSGPRSRTWDLEDNAKLSLMQKASRNDIPFEIIQEVFERGLEEYDITPRESQDRQQWGFARVNSFLTNGTRKAVDADLWEMIEIIAEGPNDPAIFKAVFLAGGPGSGKSFIAGKAGLLSFGFKLINPDPAFVSGLKKAGLEMSAKDIFSKKGQEVRKAVRALTDKQTELAIGNRLGLLVDGTGKEKEKITKLKSQVEKFGYETYLLAVNTDLETAMERNRNRARKLPDDKVKEMWLAVRNNMTYYKSIFGKNFLTVVNNKEDSPSKQSMIAYKKIGAWSKKPPSSKIAQDWIKQALDAKKTRREEVENELNEVYVLVHNNRIVDKGNKSQMNSARKALKKKTGETDHKKLFVGLSGMKPQFVDIGKKWTEEVEIKEIYKGFEKVAVIKGKPNDIKKAKSHFDRVLDTLANFTGTDIKTHIDSIERYVDKLDRLIIRGTKAGGWAMDILKKNKKLKADYDFDLSSRKLGTSMMRMGEQSFNENFENLMEMSPTEKIATAIGGAVHKRAYAAALDVYKKKTMGKKDPHRSQTAAKIAQTFKGVEPKPFVDLINKLADKGLIPKEIHASVDEGVQISLDDGAVSGDKKTRLLALYHKAFDLPPGSQAWKEVKKEIEKLRKKLNMS